MVPQITLGVICIATTILFDVLMKKSIPLADISYIGAFGNWFLLVLFLMEMVMIPIVALVSNKNILMIITLAFFALFFMTSYNGIQYVQQTLAALTFGLLGYVSRPWLDKYNECSCRCKGFGWIALLLTALLSAYNDPVAMYLNQYGNKIMFLITSVLGIYAILDISVSLKNSTFIQWCGKMSIIIYVIQFAVIRCAKSFLTMFVPYFVDNTYPCYIITFLVVMMVLIPCTWICNRYFKVLFGKK